MQVPNLSLAASYIARVACLPPVCINHLEQRVTLVLITRAPGHVRHRASKKEVPRICPLFRSLRSIHLSCWVLSEHKPRRHIAAHYVHFNSSLSMLPRQEKRQGRITHEHEL